MNFEAFNPRNLREYLREYFPEETRAEGREERGGLLMLLSLLEKSPG